MCWKTHALVVFLSIIHLSLTCNFDRNDEQAHCSSFSTLKHAGRRLDWKKLNVVNNGDQSFGAVKSGIFKEFPNVYDIQVKGLANDIDRNAWEGLHKLHEIHLDDNKINVIKSHSFANPNCQVLYVNFCDVREIMPKAFDDAPKLRLVTMYGNNISTIEEGVFTDTDMSHVILRKNKIKTVQANAFGNMENLEWLSLEENEISSISPQTAVGFAPKLTHFNINRNKISKITRKMFSVMPNLQVLLININRIQRFGDNTFSDLRKLYLLDMSNNRIEELQTNIFNARGNTAIQVLFLHDNQMTFLSSGVLIRLPKLRQITVGGNPWQCSCWDTLDYYLVHHNVTKLCDEVYKFGKRPSCVYSDKAPRDCVYDVENVRDLLGLELLEWAFKEYAALPPVCNVDGVDKPTLGARR